MAHRDSKGRFTKGNPYRFQRGDKRTIAAAKKGFHAMCQKKFDGHIGKAKEFLALCLMRDAGILDPAWFDNE